MSRTPDAVDVTIRCRPGGTGRRVAIVAIELAIGIPALPAGVGLIRDGLGLPASWIDHSLFPSYGIPGILLIVLIGGGMIAAAITALRNAAVAGAAAVAMGSIQLAWLAVETVVIGWRGGPQLGLVGGIAALATTLVVLGIGTLSLRTAAPLRAAPAAGAGRRVAVPVSGKASVR